MLRHQVKARRVLEQAVCAQPLSNECSWTTSSRCYSDKGDAASQTELVHEKEGLKNGAEFIATSVTAAAGSAKEAVARAVGLSDRKPEAEGESMLPAGRMQCKDPDTPVEEEYSQLKATSDKQWKEAKVEGKPNHLYPAHGKNA